MLIAANGLKNTDPAKANHLYELNPGAAKFWFDNEEDDKVRIARFGVWGDGSCAYHSMCAALNVRDYLHQNDDMQKQIAYQFRCSFADKLSQDALRAITKKSRSRSPVRLAEAQEALCDPKVWADEVALRFMAESLNINIIFVDMTKNHVYCGVHHEDAVKDVTTMPSTVVICWVNHSHFEPMAQILSHSPRVTEIKFQFQPSSSRKDQAMVEALMRRYKSQCLSRRKEKDA